MKTAHLFRTERSDQGTFGHLICENFHLHTGELPWRGNKPDISRILAQSYLVKWEPFGKHKGYVIKSVPDRTLIEFHIANYFGDTEKGFKSNVLGCIGLGLKRGVLHPKGFKLKQEAILSSGLAMKKFHNFFKQESFVLHIENKFES